MLEDLDESIEAEALECLRKEAELKVKYEERMMEFNLKRIRGEKGAWLNGPEEEAWRTKKEKDAS